MKVVQTSVASPDAETALDAAQVKETAHDNAPVFGRRNLIVMAVLFIVALSVALLVEWVSGANISRISAQPQYIYQAESFLHGRWDLDLPASWTDIVVLHGKHYIVYPPFPALLMMPFVAIWGLQTSDVIFTLVVSACSLSLIYLLFEQVRALGLTQRGWRENALLSLFFYYGSLNLTLSLGGRMWFTAHIICFTFTLLSLLLAFRRLYVWSAIALGCAFFSRGTVALGYPFLFYLAWQDVNREQLVQQFVRSLLHRRPDWTAIPWRRLLPPLAVTAVTLALFMARNALIFGTPFETGYNILLAQRYPQVTQGVFNVAYVPANIIANFFTFPRVTFTSAYDRHPTIDMLNQGYAVGLFVTTPLFLLLFWRNQRRSMIRLALWGTLGVVVAVVLCFHASGYYQFGARYLFDGYPYAFLLLVLNEIRFDWRVIALGLLGVVINVAGARQFWPGAAHHTATSSAALLSSWFYRRR